MLLKTLNSLLMT